MCLELMLNGVNLNLVAFSSFLDPEKFADKFLQFLLLQ
jgi:NADH:ubiquinone oxidoreductase subunit K